MYVQVLQDKKLSLTAIYSLKERLISVIIVIFDILYIFFPVFFRKSNFKLTPFFVKATLIMALLASQDKSGRCK